MQREQLLTDIQNEKIIVIVRGAEKECLIPLGEALLKGGIHQMEITFDSSAQIDDRETVDRIKMLTEHFGDRMAIGAGTVLTAEQAASAANAGAAFIVSPNADERVIRKTRELGLVSVPGALTPTEIQNASLWGADIVKIFPVTSFGPAYLKLLKAPLAHIPMAAVGGIGQHDLADYLEAGADCFCIGGALADKKKMADGNFDGIADVAEQFVTAIQEWVKAHRSSSEFSKR